MPLDHLKYQGGTVFEKNEKGKMARTCYVVVVVSPLDGLLVFFRADGLQ